MLFDFEGAHYGIVSTAEDRSHTSLHGLLRVIERTGLSEEQAIRLIRRARDRGRTAEQLPRKYQREYLNHHIRAMYNGPTKPVVYSGYLFLFSTTGILITAYALPKDFYQVHKYDTEGKLIRNLRQYYRMNPSCA